MSTRTKLWLVLVSAVLLAVATHAEPVTQLKATDYVNDFAHVLNQNAIVQMDDICRQVDEKAHAKIAVVTVRSLDGSDIESYAVALFQQWGLGTKSTNRGMLILYAIDDHRDRIEVGYGLEPILPDGKTGGFAREVVPLMRSGNYSQALLLVTQVNICLRDFRCERHLGVGEIGVDCIRFRRRGFHRASRAAEQIDLPRCIETRRVELQRSSAGRR